MKLDNLDGPLTWTSFITTTGVVEAVLSLPEEMVSELDRVQPPEAIAVLDSIVAPRAVASMLEVEGKEKEWTPDELAAISNHVIELYFEAISEKVDGVATGDIDNWRQPMFLLVVGHAAARGLKVAGLRREQPDDAEAREAGRHVLAAFADEDDAGAVEAGRAMLAAGGVLRTVDDDGTPLLHRAAASNMRAFVVFLLDEANVELNALRGGRWNAFDSAVGMGAQDTARELFERGLRSSVSIMELAKSDDEDVADAIRCLSKLSSSELKERDELGFSALHHAKMPRIAEALLEAGADVNATNERGVTPLLGAVTSYYPLETIRVLVNYGADVDAQSRSGDAPVTLALRRGKTEVLRELKRPRNPDNLLSFVDDKTPHPLKVTKEEAWRGRSSRGEVKPGDTTEACREAPRSDEAVTVVRQIIADEEPRRGKFGGTARPWNVVPIVLLIGGAIIVALYVNIRSRTTISIHVGQTYRGTYTCAQGVTDLWLRIQDARPNADGAVFVTAIFDFHHPTTAARGRFYMSGPYTPASRSVQLRAGQWVEHPRGYSTVDMSGLLDSRGTISGQIHGPGCSSFKVQLER